MRSRRRTSRIVASCAVGFALLVPGWAGATSARPHLTKSAASSPLKVIGELPEPASGSVRYREGHIVQVDAASRRMYYAYADPQGTEHLVTYDLRPRIPQPIASGVLGSSEGYIYSPYVDALDTKRGRLMMLGIGADAGGQFVAAGNPSLTFYDTKHNRVVDDWNMEKVLPGYFPIGLTYSRADDRLYMVGEFSGDFYGVSATPTFGSKLAGPGTAVVALDPATGKVLWVRPVPECQQALYTLLLGGLIARSELRPSLYFACVTGGMPANVTYPGEAALIRLDIDPHAASPADAKSFDVEAFPISGNYFNGASTGIATFDYQRDRYFLQSLAVRTPGDWVFDGRMSGWVGFIPAPDDSDGFAGYNEGLGHLYISTYLVPNGTNIPKTNGMVVADGRTSPVQAGSFEPLVTNTFIPTDARSNRMFVQPPNAGDNGDPYQVVVDRSPRRHPLRPLDYDTLTDGVPESRADFVNYSADLNAYAADVVLVGGVGAPLSAPGFADVEPPVAGGTRGLMLAALTGIGLRPAGASASGQAVVADLNTTQDYQNNASLGAWPYAIASCLDSGGGTRPQSASHTGGTSHVDCNLAKARVDGDTNAAGVSAGPVQVGHANTVASTWRTSAQGVETSVRSFASGISVALPGAGSLEIGQVAARLTSRAHGTDGAGAARYERTVHGVRLVGKSGKTTFGPTACSTTIVAVSGRHRRTSDSCAALGRALSSAAKTRLHVSFPMPAASATPGGAFAGVQQSFADFYQERTVNDQGVVYPKDSTALRPSPALQIETYNDTTERSRVLAQFAGVQGDSIFATGAGDGDGPAGPPLGSEPTGRGTHPAGGAPGHPGHGGAVVPGGDTTKTTDLTTSPPAVAAAPASGLAGWLFVHRSLRDALLLASVLALVAGAVLLAFRRQRLLTAMTITTERPSS